MMKTKVDGKTLTKVEFDDQEISKEAFEVYSNSSFIFYMSYANEYYVADNQDSRPSYLSDNIEGVEEFLKAFV